jgi:hypothetical protein
MEAHRAETASALLRDTPAFLLIGLLPLITKMVSVLSRTGMTNAVTARQG